MTSTSPYRENAVSNKTPEIEVGAAQLMLYLTTGEVKYINLVAKWTPRYRHINHRGIERDSEYDTIEDIKDVVRNFIQKIVRCGYVCVISKNDNVEKFIMLRSIIDITATYSKTTVGPTEPTFLDVDYKFISFIF